MEKIMIILIGNILVDNFVLSKFLGICPFLGVSKKLDSAFGMSAAVIFVMTLASAVTWPIYHLLLDPLKLNYMDTVVFILVIAAMVQLVETVMKKILPALHKSLGIYLPLITTNCAVLGVATLNIKETYGFLESVVSGFSAGLGFMLAMVLFAGVRRRVDAADVPECFKGLPITLLAASMVSMSFMGFAGLAENLFR
ncbi:MAG: electron transport complex subunit RsxA [Oscillospiraceae bacterium]|nr:electron transport complex subunit RsxA [Oscillospiraceae bacterium]